MNETQAIVEAWRQIRDMGETTFLATVAQTEGSTYRRPGARMLFTRNGWVAGSISGGCLEADMLQTAWDRTEHGPVLVTYDSTANEDIVWGFGLGCNGVVHVLLERLSAADALNEGNAVLAFLQTCLEQRKPGVIASVLRVENRNGEDATVCVGNRLLLHEDGSCEGSLRDSGLKQDLLADLKTSLQSGKTEVRHYGTEGGQLEVSIETILPPRPMVIFGAGQDALPVVRLAKQMGWHVTVVDPRCTRSSSERFAEADVVVGCTPDGLRHKLEITPETFTLLMTHNFLHDADLLAQLLVSPAHYIGVLGPKKRLHRLLEHINGEGIAPSEAQTARLHGPVGLDIGADNPDEIALSILAELQAVASGRMGGALREREAPLHIQSTEGTAALIQAERDRQSSPFNCPLS